MNGPYCPDCGAACSPGADDCLECGFPLVIEMISQDHGVRIAAGQMERWKRIAQLLKRGGLRIKTESDPAAGMVWWLLPLAGMVIFLCTLLFGHKIVDKIWLPPVAAPAVVDLNNPNGQSDDEDAVDDASVDFLHSAFKTNAAQRADSEAESVNLDTFIDRPVADLDKVKKVLNQVFLDVVVDDRERRGTLVTPDGGFLVDINQVADAFRRENRTVNQDHSIHETAVWITPEVSFPARGAGRPAQRVVDGTIVGLSLLSADLPSDLQVDIEFSHNLDVGHEVWVAKEVGGKLYPEKVKVLDSMPINEDVKVWVIGGDLGVYYSGAPVVDIYGKLTGVVLYINGETAVVPMMTVRERAPLIYKQIYK